MMQRREGASDPMRLAVCALGIAQITAWGTSYYCLGVLAGPIVTETGWSRSLVYFGFTVALLAMGSVSVLAGRAIDRYGARTVMAVGTLLVSAGLYARRCAQRAAYLGLGVPRFRLRLSLTTRPSPPGQSRLPRTLAISYRTLFAPSPRPWACAAII